MTDKNSKNQKALSLVYDGFNAPEIAIKGYNDLADQIIEHAKKHNLLIHKDKVLFERLEQLAIGEKIPPNMYVVIAELIAFSYLLQGKFPESWQ